MKPIFRRTLSLLLTVFLLLTLFAGCKKGKTADSADNEALYVGILAKYKQALDENWTESKFFEGNLCPLLAPSREKTAEPGFAFLDINRDKRPELFIGRVSEPGIVYDLYTTRSNGTVVQLGVANETTRFVYTADERLIQENTPTEALTATKMLTLNDDALEVIETYIRDADKTFDSENEWFRADGDVSLDALDAADTLEPISEDAYNEATSYQPANLSLQAFAAWGSETAPSAEEATSVNESTTEAPAYDESSLTFQLGESYYQSLLNKYRAAFAEHLPDADAYKSRGFSALFWQLLEDGGIPGYRFIENDHSSSVSEDEIDYDCPYLIVGGTNEPALIYDLYTITDDFELIKIISSSKKDRYYYCDDGKIANEKSDAVRFFTLKNGKLAPVKDEKTTNYNPANIGLKPFEIPETSFSLETAKKMYASTLKEFKKLLTDKNRKYGQFTKSGFSEAFEDFEPGSSTPVYTFADLDSDGTPELMLALLNEYKQSIYDLFTIKDGKVVHLAKSISSKETFTITSYYYCKDNLIKEEGEYAFDDVHSTCFYELKNGTLHLLDAYAREGEWMEPGTYYHSTKEVKRQNGHFDLSGMQVIDETAYNQGTEAHETDDLLWFPLDLK